MRPLMSTVIRVRCPAPRAVSAAVMTWTVTSHGDVAVYVCHHGYRFVDRGRTTSAVCVNGIWSTAVPDCTRTFAAWQLVACEQRFKVLHPCFQLLSGGYNYVSTWIRLPFDYSSTAIRPSCDAESRSNCVARESNRSWIEVVTTVYI